MDSELINNMPYGENTMKKNRADEGQNGTGWGRVLF